MLKTATDVPVNEQEWRTLLFEIVFGQVIASGGETALPVITTKQIAHQLALRCRNGHLVAVAHLLRRADANLEGTPA